MPYDGPRKRAFVFLDPINVSYTGTDTKNISYTGSDPNQYHCFTVAVTHTGYVNSPVTYAGV